MILRLLRVELLKIRRSLVLLMTVACPLAIVGLMLLVGLCGRGSCCHCSLLFPPA